MNNESTILRYMLNSTGEAGADVNNAFHPSVVAAKSVLDQVNLDFQARGWWFNSDYNFTLVPNEDGEVSVPATSLGVLISDRQKAIGIADKRRFVIREDKIYDTYTHGYDVGIEIDVDIIRNVAYEYLPHVAFAYVKQAATLEFYENDDADRFKTERLNTRVTNAWRDLYSRQLDFLQSSALDTPHALRMRFGGAGIDNENPNFLGGIGRY